MENIVPIDTTAEIIKLVYQIMWNWTMIVETINEALLVKMFEIRWTPLNIKKTYRDIDKDFEREYLNPQSL